MHNLLLIMIILCILIVVAGMLGFLGGKREMRRRNSNKLYPDIFEFMSCLPLEKAHVQICRYDMKTDIITLTPNPRDLVTTGTKLISFLEIVDEQYKEVFLNAIDQMKREGVASFRYKIHYKDHDGTKKEMWLSNFTFVYERDGKGEPTKSISILHDVTNDIQGKETEAINRLHIERFLNASHMILWSYNEVTDEVKNETHIPGMFKSITSEQYINTLVLPTSQELVRRSFDRCIKHLSTVFDVVFQVYVKANRIEWVHSVGQVVTDEPSDPIKIIGHSGIVTEERLAAIELGEKNTMLKLALKAAKMTPWKYTIATDIYTTESTLNPGTSISIDSASFLSHHFFPEDVKRLTDWIERLRHGAISSIDVNMRCFITSKNDIRWVQIKGEVVEYDSNGHPACVIGTHRFVNNDLNYLMVLRQKEQLEFTLKVSKMTAWVYMRSNDMITIYSGETDSTREITLFDYARQLIEPSYRKNVLSIVSDLISGKLPEFTFTYRRMNEKGEYRVLSCAAMGTDRDLSGKANRLIGSTKDITEEQRKMEELVKLHKKAEESSNLKTAFLANMSHEIRTPLNAIVGFSNIIAQKIEPERNEEYCRIIELNNKLLLQLISDIIDLSSIETDQMAFEEKDFDICKMIHDNEVKYSSELSKGVEIICDCPDESLIVKSNPKRLNQVLSKIIDNAVKHTHSGFITIGYYSEADDIRFFVRDTGKGITQENLPHVFDRFAKFDAFTQGTGLGLSLCQSIVHKFGGQIGAKSEIGKGSEFWFTLPLHKETATTTGD